MRQPLRYLGWATDLHLNFVSFSQWDELTERIRASGVQALLVTGDISEADDVVWQLERMANAFSGPIYFVLGNHDFYRGSIRSVRSGVRAACESHPRLNYLTGAEPIRLSDDWVLCGEDGWADGRLGDYFRSPIRMNDFVSIEDLRDLDSVTRLRFLRREGAACAMRLLRQLHSSATMSRRILVLTHVPPFRESCWYEGRHTDDDWAPFFTCHATGWALRRFCRRHAQHEVLVLCGHTHHGGRSQIAENLKVWTGGAEYGEPSLSGVVDLHTVDDAPADWSYSP